MNPTSEEKNRKYFSTHFLKPAYLYQNLTNAIQEGKEVEVTSKTAVFLPFSLKETDKTIQQCLV